MARHYAADALFRVSVGDFYYGPYVSLGAARSLRNRLNNERERWPSVHGYRPEAHIEKADVTWVPLEGE